MEYLKKWKRHAIIGVTLIGVGINFVAEATIIKSRTPEFYDMSVLGHMALWFWVGLFGLVALNAGVSFMGDAVKNRTLYELKNSGENE
ncbi:MAG: hypothetical protein JJU41_04735 [Bacteroidetes bacterium]|nr:hypothetical protein [Bacteroidota bacterium]MCH8524099.1 hypothetical protein [Balneolales bacterium]